MAKAKLEEFKEPSLSLAAFAKALGHPARIEILRFLSGKGEVNCMDIVESLPLSQPSCSRHINTLQKAGLLKSRIAGSHVLYKVDTAALRRFCKALTQTLHP